jgi:PIN domain nuclease of toxin-antitoxin system
LIAPIFSLVFQPSELLLIWADLSPEKLSQSCRDLLLDLDNVLLLSLASVWEMQIEYQLDKLNLRLPLPDLIRE